jgi:hypothetical protein
MTKEGLASFRNYMFINNSSELNVTPQPLHTKKKILSGYRSLIKNEAEVIAALQYSRFRNRIGLL